MMYSSLVVVSQCNVAIYAFANIYISLFVWLFYTVVHFDTWLPRTVKLFTGTCCYTFAPSIPWTWAQRMGCDRKHKCVERRDLVTCSDQAGAAAAADASVAVPCTACGNVASVALTHRQLVGSFRVFPLVIYLFSCFFSPFSFCFSRIKSSFSIVVVCLSFSFCSWFRGLLTWSRRLFVWLLFVFRRLSCCRSVDRLLVRSSCHLFFHRRPFPTSQPRHSPHRSDIIIINIQIRCNLNYGI